MMGEVSSDRPAAGQSVNGIHMLSFLFASFPLTLLLIPSSSLAMHAQSRHRIALTISTCQVKCGMDCCVAHGNQLDIDERIQSLIDAGPTV